MFSNRKIGLAAVRRAASATLATLLLAGCATEESAVKADFGRSVRAMIQAQTVREPAAVPSLDGQKSQRVLGVYRDNVASPKSVEQDIVIRVGQ